MADWLPVQHTIVPPDSLCCQARGSRKPVCVAQDKDRAPRNAGVHMLRERARGLEPPAPGTIASMPHGHSSITLDPAAGPRSAQSLIFSRAGSHAIPPRSTLPRPLEANHWDHCSMPP
ncbi:unnamed protein product [Gadus morhua 'NCC']